MVKHRDRLTQREKTLLQNLDIASRMEGIKVFKSRPGTIHDARGPPFRTASRVMTKERNPTAAPERLRLSSGTLHSFLRSLVERSELSFLSKRVSDFARPISRAVSHHALIQPSMSRLIFQ